jgi:acyl carrier protein
MSEILDVPAEQLRLDSRLSDIEGWTSIAVLSFMAFADEYAGARVSAQGLKECSTLQDLAALIGLTVETAAL